MFYEGNHPEDCDCAFHQPRCSCCSARVRRDEADAAPAQVLCVFCIEEQAAEMTPQSLPQLCAEVSALRRFGYADSDRPLRGKVEQLRRIAA